MITSLTIRGLATYNDETPALNDLKRINFFFGLNGSGKSTISKYLYNLSINNVNENTKYSKCSHEGYDSSKENILVYDDEFIKRNFIEKDTLKGIFSLNETNNDIENKIKEKKSELEIVNSYIKTLNNRCAFLETTNSNKDKDIYNICFSQRDMFKTYSKINLSYKGNKQKNFENILKYISFEEKDKKDLIYFNTTYNELYEKEKIRINSSVNIEKYNDIIKIENDLSLLLSEIIIGNEDVKIANFIKEYDIRNWIEKGNDIVKETNGICPFCQQKTITESFLTDLANYFDETYKQKILEIKKLRDDYNNKYNIFIIELSSLQEKYNINNEVSNLINSIKTKLNNGILIIDNKIQNPNINTYILDSISEYKTEIDTINENISKHNNTIDTIDELKEKFVNDVWIYMALNSKDKINEYNKAKDICKKLSEKNIEDLKKNENIILEINKEISTLQNGTTNTDKAVDEINKLLRNTNFTNFKIEKVSETNKITEYQIIRENKEKAFKTLSEGEKHIITFFYFYQLCLGTDDKKNTNKKKIIVIDDPVSSMDNNSLFFISAILKSLCAKNNKDKNKFNNENYVQFFILTHNLYFYKEITFDKRNLCNDVFYYEIKKVNNITNIKGYKNSQIKNDYALMWNSIKTAKEKLQLNDYENNIFIANTIRRILESYISFVGNENSVWSLLRETHYFDDNYHIISAFLSQINDDSHKVLPFDDLYYNKISKEKTKKLIDVFEYIFNTIGKEHYNKMME